VHERQHEHSATTQERELRESGWLKAVAPPQVMIRPAGLPPKPAPQPAPAPTNTTTEE
jgi:hypothetical protein